jgi:hypothetical protein
MKTLRAIGSAEAAQIVEDRVVLDGIEKRICTDYSVSDHQGRTWLTPFPVAGTARDGMRLSARFLYPSREPQRPRHVVFGLESTSLQARFEAVRELTWVADGRAIRMGGLERSWSRGQNGGVIEQLSGLLPVGEFFTLATAKTLRARIGPLEFAVARPDLIALRHFAEKIPPATPARPPPLSARRSNGRLFAPGRPRRRPIPGRFARDCPEACDPAGNSIEVSASDAASGLSCAPLRKVRRECDVEWRIAL